MVRYLGRVAPTIVFKVMLLGYMYIELLMR